jgi:hypothetical protein
MSGPSKTLCRFRGGSLAQAWVTSGYTVRKLVSQRLNRCLLSATLFEDRVLKDKPFGSSLCVVVRS